MLVILKNKSILIKAVFLISAFMLIISGIFVVTNSLFNNKKESSEISLNLNDGIIFGNDTPIRIGTEGTLSCRFEKLITMQDANNESDLVAEVIITEWLGEFDEKGYDQLTYFKAKIINKYKNTNNLDKDEIILIQNGNSKFTFKGYPLFKNGDKLLLCLNSVSHEIYTNDKSDCYVINGSQMTELKVIEYQENKYLIKINGHESMKDFSLCSNADVVNIVKGIISSDDIILAKTQIEFAQIFEFNDVLSKLNK